jgi:hypothetical protein
VQTFQFGLFEPGMMKSSFFSPGTFLLKNVLFNGLAVGVGVATLLGL